MSVEFKDYYKSLGVSRSATEDEIRKAFRKLAREHHPDVAKNKATGEEKFKEINEAYEVLGDPQKRKRYDELGAEWNQPGGFRPPPGWQQHARGPGAGRPGEEFEFHFGGTGFSDFFEQFFGSRGAGFRGARGFDMDGRGGEGIGGTMPQRGTDIEGAILVTLQEAVHGSVRNVSFQRVDPRVGQAETQSFRVRIPAGVQEGQLIRVAGKGEAGSARGAPGDLYLRVKFSKHPEFRVREGDLYHDAELAPWEAVLGTALEVPTLDARITVRVPPGTRSGQKLRVRGKGLLNKAGGRGDLYVVVTVQVPGEISAEERRLWEDLAARSHFNPRKTS